LGSSRTEFLQIDASDRASLADVTVFV